MLGQIDQLRGQPAIDPNQLLRPEVLSQLPFHQIIALKQHFANVPQVQGMLDQFAAHAYQKAATLQNMVAQNEGMLTGADKAKALEMEKTLGVQVDPYLEGKAIVHEDNKPVYIKQEKPQYVEQEAAKRALAKQKADDEARKSQNRSRQEYEDFLMNTEPSQLTPQQRQDKLDLIMSKRRRG